MAGRSTFLPRLSEKLMPPESDLQDSIEKSRQAFRTQAEGRPIFPRDYEEPAERTGGVGGGTVPLDAREPVGLHPFFQGLLDTLPGPGADWPQAQREQWLETARNIFALIYTDLGEADESARPIDIRRDTRTIEPERRTA